MVINTIKYCKNYEKLCMQFLPMVLILKIERTFNNKEFENSHDIEELKIFSKFFNFY